MAARVALHGGATHAQREHVVHLMPDRLCADMLGVHFVRFVDVANVPRIDAIPDVQWDVACQRLARRGREYRVQAREGGRWRRQSRARSACNPARRAAQQVLARCAGNARVADQGLSNVQSVTDIVPAVPARAGLRMMTRTDDLVLCIASLRCVTQSSGRTGAECGRATPA
jgi:hypothetical protein